MKKSDPDSIETQYYEALFEAEKLRKENAELRRQLAEEKETLRVVLDELGASHKVEDESIDLRRQLAEVQEDEVIIISERDAAEKEAADLRRQLAECQLAQTAIPVAALRRCFYTGYETDAQVEEDEIAIAAWLEVQP